MFDYKHSTFLSGGLALLALVSLPLSNAQAEGFYIPMHSPVTTATAVAGAAAKAWDSTIIYYNPAGMTELDGAQTALSIDASFGQNDTSNNGSTILGASTGNIDGDDSLPTQPLINNFAAWPIVEDKLWFGMGGATPFGNATKYDPDWAGRYDSIKSELLTVNVQPTLAYKVTPWMSVGAGLNVEYIEVTTTQAINNGVTEGNARLKGEDIGFGYNVGAHFRVSDKTNVGVAYRSHIEHDLEGDYKVTGVPGLNEESKASAEITLPDILSIGVSHEIDEKWTALAQFSYFGWDSYDVIQPTRKGGAVIQTINAQYDNTIAASVGAEYKVNDKWTVRGGYQFDETPTDNQFTSTSVLGGDRHNFAAGFSYYPNEKWSYEVGFLHGFIDDNNVVATQNAGLAQVNIQRDNSTYQVLSIGFNYKF